MLCTLPDLKLYLSIDNTNQDALLTNLINSASSYIESYTNRIFDVTDYTEKISGTNKSVLPISNAPILEVTSVVSPNGTVVAVDFTNTLLTMQNDIFYSGVWVVKYKGGFNDIPYDVSQACIELAAYKFKDRDRIGVSSKTLAGETITFEKKDIRGDIKNVLSNYVRVY